MTPCPSPPSPTTFCRPTTFQPTLLVFSCSQLCLLTYPPRQSCLPQPSRYCHLSLPASSGELIKPREVVINRCYGGYSLSSATIKLLISRHGLKGEVWDDDDPYYGAGLDSTLSRHDPRLVEVVKELGPLLSAGQCAYLVIEKTYCDRYFIDEYDGLETLRTPHSLGFEWVLMDQNMCDHPPDNRWSRSAEAKLEDQRCTRVFESARRQLKLQIRD